MSSTVTVGGMEISSNTEGAAEMVETLTPAKEDAGKPKAIEDRGKPVEGEKDPNAVELGKKGGAAAAKARQAKPIKDTRTPAPKADEEGSGPPKKPEAKTGEAEPGAEKKDDKYGGDPRHSPEARAKAAAEQARRQVEAAERRHQAEKQELVARLERLERAQGGGKAGDEPQPGPRTEAKAPAGKPDPSKYDDWQKYEDDRFAWEKQQWQHEQDAHAHARQHTERLKAHVDNFDRRVSVKLEADPTLAERLPAFRDVVMNSSHFAPDGAPVTAFMAINDLILESDVEAELMEYLGANPQEMERLLSLKGAPTKEYPDGEPNLNRITREVGRIEARLERAAGGDDEGEDNDPPAPPARGTRAKPPMVPVKGAPPTTDPDLHEEQEFDTFMKRKKDIAARRR